MGVNTILSDDERYQEDIDQVQYLVDYSERKKNKKSERRKKRADLMQIFKSNTKA